MFFQCCATVCNDDSELKKHWVNVSAEIFVVDKLFILSGSAARWKIQISTPKICYLKIPMFI